MPEPPSPDQVSSSPGITYLSVSEQGHEGIRVQPDNAVTWWRKRISPESGLSTTVELRWTARAQIFGALSEVMYELTGQQQGAIGVRDARNRWRAVRVRPAAACLR